MSRLLACLLAHAGPPFMARLSGRTLLRIVVAHMTRYNLLLFAGPQLALVGASWQTWPSCHRCGGTPRASDCINEGGAALTAKELVGSAN